MNSRPNISFAARFLVGCSLAALAISCSGKEESKGTGGDGDGDTRPDDGTTASFCESPSDCFPDVDEGALSGEAQCLDRVDGGYCTHLCETDADCCAAEGECPASTHQVCSPFESSGLMMCFLSCEDEDVALVEADDEFAYCQQYAGTDFICRSSGGGSANRRVCVPGDCNVGADCTEDADCTGDLTCALGYLGGYCTRAGCTSDADCPNDSACVDDGGAEPLCMKTCSAPSDCSFCRPDGMFASCETAVDFVDGADRSVCVPEHR